MGEEKVSNDCGCSEILEDEDGKHIKCSFCSDGFIYKPNLPTFPDDHLLPGEDTDGDLEYCSHCDGSGICPEKIAENQVASY